MMEPVFSPKVEAYISVMDKIKNFRLKRGIFSDEYTRQVNLEIAGIRKRLNAAAHRARTAEVIREKCEENPEFAARWKRMKLQTAFLNSIKRRRKAYDQLVKFESSPSGQSSNQSDNSGGSHAVQD